MRKRNLWIILLLSALLLSGCGTKKEAESAPASTSAADSQPTAQPQGQLAETARMILAAYEQELSQVAAQSPYNLTYTIPGDMLNQMALDAQETGAVPVDGRYVFTRRESGRFTYESTSEEALNEWIDEEAATPDPAEEAPMDSQLNGDYAVSGGGLFDRVRSYDAAEDLTSGVVEITDSLNGAVTGSERFSFALRGQELYFTDATLDQTSDMDGVQMQEGYLAAVGVLRPDGLDIVEYRISDLALLPDPATLNWASFSVSVTPQTSLSAQGDQVQSQP